MNASVTKDTKDYNEIENRIRELLDIYGYPYTFQLYYNTKFYNIDVVHLLTHYNNIDVEVIEDECL